MKPAIPLYLITGFLGSGKTTFLQRIIEYFSGKQKIAIVQNEFAPANFDGMELKRTSSAEFELLEVNNGSVFCVCLLSGFIESLNSFVTKYQPEIVLMEASGLSDPVSVGQIFNSPKLQETLYLAGTICIVDALNYTKFDNLVSRINHQLQIADVVLINKTDLAVNTKDIEEKISKINPFATLYFSNHCQIPLEELFSAPFQKQKKLFFVPGTSDRPELNSLVFRSTKPIKEQHISAFIQKLASETIRIKGYVLLDNKSSVTVQCIFDEIHISPINTTIKQTELIIIGKIKDIRFVKDIYQLFTPQP